MSCPSVQDDEQLKMLKYPWVLDLLLQMETKQGAIITELIKKLTQNPKVLWLDVLLKCTFGVIVNFFIKEPDIF